MALTTGYGSGQFDVFVRENETSIMDLEVFTFNEITPNIPGPGQEFPDQGPLENAPVESDWTDSWYLNFGTMKLVHNGAKVTGEYHNDLNGANGTIKGTLSGNVFDGTWSNGTRSGSLHWVFHSNGDSFTGNFNGSTAWCGARTGKPFPANCSFSGNWTANVAGNRNCSMKLVRTDLSVEGTYCNGTVSGEISYGGNANETILTGTWSTNNRGPFKLYLIGYDGLQFQGNWDKTNAWCGWRANQTAPSPCLR